LSTRRPEPFSDDGGYLVLRQVAGALAGTFDQGAQLVVGKTAERRVDLLEAGTRREQQWEHLARELLALRLWQSQDFPGERSYARCFHWGTVLHVAVPTVAQAPPPL
jgi:hypothetical protein